MIMFDFILQKQKQKKKQYKNRKQNGEIEKSYKPKFNIQIT